MEVTHNVISSLARSDLVINSSCGTRILQTPGSQDQLLASSLIAEEDVESHPTCAEICDVRRCPLQEVEEQELGEEQGDMMALLLQERQENPPPQTTLGVTRRFIYDG